MHQININGFQKTLSLYGKDWCTYENASTVSIAEYVWSDFINKYSVDSIGWLWKNGLRDVHDTLINKGVYIQFGSQISMVEAVRPCWCFKTCPIISEKSIKDTGLIHLQRKKQLRSRKWMKRNEIKVFQMNLKSGKPIHHLLKTSIASNEKMGESPTLSSKFLSCQNSRSGSDEDLMPLFERYEETCDLYEISDEMMFQGMPMPLEGGSISIFISNIRRELVGAPDKYHTVVRMVMKKYTSDDYIQRLL